MGRKRLTIRRLESQKARQAKFSKRKKGFLKKASELSILCDVDLALVMFSPAAKPTLFVGQNKDLCTVLTKLSRVPVEEREERRAYTMKILKKMHENESNSGTDPRTFSPDRAEVLKLQRERLRELKHRLEEKSSILRDWQNPMEVDDLNQIKIMEEHVVSSISRIKNKKIQLEQQQQSAMQAGTMKK